MNILIKLFIEFFKVGTFSIGGGNATIPFLYDISDKTNWYTYTDISNMIAISESTPGAIGINMATYIGFITQGLSGAILATIGLILPSIIIINIISNFFYKFKQNDYIKNIFYILRPTSIALIAVAFLETIKISLININNFYTENKLIDIFKFKEIIFAIILFLIIKKFNKHPIFYIILSAFIGIIFKFSS